MTTPEAARRYEAQHVAEFRGRKLVVHNPRGRPVEDLPVIYGFNNGGRPGWFSAVAISEDGVGLAGHICSSEAFMPHDLGCIEGGFMDKHETYRKHYPDGYRMEFVPTEDMDRHEGFQEACRINQGED